MVRGRSGWSRLVSLGMAVCIIAVSGCAATERRTDDGGDIKIGWLSSLSGPLSAAAVAENRGVRYAVDQINAEGGIDGRRIDLIVRDTGGDPTKAVNMSNELTLKDEVDFIIGPVNSGEALPAVPVIAKRDTTNIIIGTVDSLTDPEKFPLAYRTIPTNEQWVQAATDYLVGRLGIKKVAIFGDTTGYGTDTVNQAVDLVENAGGSVVYRGLIDVNQTDVTSDVAKARSAGAEGVMIWSAAAGLGGRLINARAALGWDVPIAGHPALASGDTGKLLSDKANWSNVFAVGYRSMSRDSSGRLPARTTEFIASAGTEVLGESITYTLWWVALGYDSVQTIKHAVITAGSTDPDAIEEALDATADLPGVFGDYTWGPDNRNGFPLESVVMNEASSFDEGTFTLAPGYT